LWYAPQADAVPKVESHDLDCGNHFPCPAEIQRRVDFWIHVFRTWSTQQIVFHDSHQPERVYSVLTNEDGCKRRRPGRKVEKEFQRIRTQLDRLANKIGSKHPGLSRSDVELLSLFPDRDAREIRRAAEDIRCQQGNRDRFLDALERYGTYRDHVLNVLRDSKLSEDILYLPFVESAYNPRAYSWAGAAGLWQIMPRTARKLGLQLNATVDERFDPEAATWAAARYLRDSTDELTEAARRKNPAVTAEQINPFVITSYNYGVSGMRRAIESVGPDYVKVLEKYRSRGFRVAVKNFYASFLAARHVARNAERYFGKHDTASAARHSTVVLEHPTSVDRIEDVFKVKKDVLKELNPSLTRYVWRGVRLVPNGFKLHLPYRADNWRASRAALAELRPESPEMSGTQYTVQRGDTACGIATAFGVSCRDLIDLNALGRRAFIRTGQRLHIPSKSVATARAPKRDARPKILSASVAPSPSKEQQWRVSEKPVPKEAGKTAEKTPEKAPELSADEVFKRLSDSIKVDVYITQTNGKSVYAVLVEPEETLGHYADWLGIGGSGELRRMNGVKSDRRLQIGQRIYIPVKDDEAREKFENARLEYHRTLVDEFQQHYEITGVEYYVVKRGDSLWRIAQENELPYWVVTRLNPKTENPAIGDRLVLPAARARKPSKEPPVTDPS